MIGLIFSLDYEIYGSGAGDFDDLMVRPTDKLLTLFNEARAKLTIMVEVAEILALKRQPEFAEVVGRIESQLRRALSEGHDLQLHLHPAWFNATFENGRWRLDLDEYALTGLPRDKIREYLTRGKEYLEALARPVAPSYRCLAFRAGNWLIQPSRDTVAALEEAGFLFDTSVFKHGWGRTGPFALDYRNAHSDLFSWVVDPEDINRAADREGLREVPILCRRVPAPSMLTWKRVKRQLELRRQSRKHQKAAHESERRDEPGAGGRPNGTPRGGSRRVDGKLRLLYPKKFDFSRMTCRELKTFLRYAERRCRGMRTLVPVVAIGHSTEHTNDSDLRRFLEHVQTRRDEVTWTTFSALAEQSPG